MEPDRHRRTVPWRSLVVAAAALVAAGHPGVARLAYEREAILRGELWRLWTGHLAHAGSYHLLWNVLPLIGLGLLWERLLGRGFWYLLGVSATCVGVGLLVLDPALVGYVGLSGALNGIWIGGALLAASREAARGNRQGQLLFAAFVVLDLAKIALEAWTGNPVFTETQSLGVRAVPLAHALGALGGVLWFATFRIVRSMEVTMEHSVRRWPMLSRTWILITCFLGLAGSTAAAGLAFERYEVITGSAKRQTVLTGFLLGGPVAELAVVQVDENDECRLRIYAFSDSKWVPRLDTTLGSEVWFVDVASIGGRDRLVSYEPGRLNWFDPESATERVLLDVTSNFSPPRKGEIPHVDITRDVNADNRDDLVVPDVDGFRVFIQTGDGAFADPLKVGPPTDMSRIRGADGYRYDPWSESRIHEMDYDLDGRSDLVFWAGDHFEVHQQGERGLFSPEAATFTTDVAFDSDDLSSLASGDMTGRVLHALTDLNGDGVGDLVINALEGERISSKRSAYEVHFGARAPAGGTAFASQVGATFRSDGRIQLGMVRHEFDSGGEVGLMLTSIEVEHLESSLWKRLKGLMGDDVGLDVEFYQTQGGLFPDKPNFTRGIALDGVPSHREPGWVPLEIVLRGRTHESRKTQEVWPRAFNRTLLVGDVTGDGRSDLLIEPEFRELLVFVGVPGPGLFAREPQSVAVLLHDEEYAWLTDLNGDGKQDILVHHPFTLRDPHGARMQPAGTEPHRLTLLIAR